MQKFSLINSTGRQPIWSTYNTVVVKLYNLEAPSLYELEAPSTLSIVQAQNRPAQRRWTAARSMAGGFRFHAHCMSASHRSHW